LLLDEPTNHLDLFAKSVLLQALKRYPGTILFVSHDHDFIQELATDILELSPNGLYHYPGKYEEFLQDSKKHEPTTQKNATKEPKQKEKPAELSTQKRRDIRKTEQKIAKLEKQLEKREKLGTITEVNNKDEAEIALEVLADAMKIEKEVEAKRKELVAPINDVKNKIQARANELKDILPAEVKRVKGLVIDFQTRQEALERKAREEEMERQRKAQEKLDAEKAELDNVGDFLSDEEKAAKEQELAELEAEASQTNEFKDTKTKGMRSTWKGEVTDESKVPREYLVVDQTLINKAVKDGVRNIPGVRIFEEKNLAVRTK